MLERVRMRSSVAVLIGIVLGCLGCGGWYVWCWIERMATGKGQGEACPTGGCSVCEGERRAKEVYRYFISLN